MTCFIYRITLRSITLPKKCWCSTNCFIQRAEKQFFASHIGDKSYWFLSFFCCCVWGTDIRFFWFFLNSQGLLMEKPFVCTSNRMARDMINRLPHTLPWGIVQNKSSALWSDSALFIWRWDRELKRFTENGGRIDAEGKVNSWLNSTDVLLRPHGVQT